MIPRPLATVIITLVTLIWAINFSLQFIVTTYHPDVAINGVFLAVVGGALALSRKEHAAEVYSPDTGNGRHRDGQPSPSRRLSRAEEDREIDRDRRERFEEFERYERIQRDLEWDRERHQRELEWDRERERDHEMPPEHGGDPTSSAG